MKIAGLKNDGAWFRLNRDVRKLSDEEKTNLVTQVAAIPSCDTALAAINSMLTKAGVTITGYPTTASAWADTLINTGIPRQVWMGTMTFDLYTKQADGSFKKDTENNLRVFAKNLRHTVSRYMRTIREAKDLADVGGIKEGNPGGDPDGTKPKA